MMAAADPTMEPSTLGKMGAGIFVLTALSDP